MNDQQYKADNTNTCCTHWDQKLCDANTKSAREYQWEMCNNETFPAVNKNLIVEQVNN